MSHATKPAKPVKGTCRWIRRIGHADGAALEINGTAYDVIPFDGGFRLVKSDGTAYDIDAESWQCDCPDATYRGRECKHAKALRAALAVCSK